MDGASAASTGAAELRATRTLWSGRDEANRLSPPGLYVCHIRLKTQLGEQQISRTIGLAY